MDLSPNRLPADSDPYSLLRLRESVCDCARLGVSMRYRRIVCFLMGSWIGVSAMLALAVYRNFDAVETILKSPPELEQTQRIFTMLGSENARMLLRYTAGV